MKRFTKYLLASAAVLSLAAVPVLAAGPGSGGGPGGCNQNQIVETLKLTDAQKAAYASFQKLATETRAEHQNVRNAMDPAAIQAMTPEQFREHQTEMMKTRIEAKTKLFTARQAFIATLSDEQKKELGNGFGMGPEGKMGGRHGGGRWM
ncbi:MAG: Spy/CpxP family protein refolding chaperone [Alphaproteobacteria bacterium]|nr:Spy/CpxP family protein refolding chaperone [Alphaproteobacteria bacterium]